MSKEKKRISPFKVNFGEIISIFANRLREKHNRLIEKKPDADQWLSKQSTMMKADYGYSFWGE